MLEFFSRKRHQKGFTLIELLVVIAIVGNLATIVLVYLNTARQKARDVRRISDMRQIALALEMYYDDANPPSYPGAGWGTMESALEGGGYMSSVPSDPGANTYEYGRAGDGQNYVLDATLEDTSHRALNDDVDGTVYGVGCGDPEYCIQP